MTTRMMMRMHASSATQPMLLGSCTVTAICQRFTRPTRAADFYARVPDSVAQQLGWKEQLQSDAQAGMRGLARGDSSWLCLIASRCQVMGLQGR